MSDEVSVSASVLLRAAELLDVMARAHIEEDHASSTRLAWFEQAQVLAAELISAVAPSRCEHGLRLNKTCPLCDPEQFHLEYLRAAERVVPFPPEEDVRRAFIESGAPYAVKAADGLGVMG